MAARLIGIVLSIVIFCFPVNSEVRDQDVILDAFCGLLGGIAGYSLSQQLKVDAMLVGYPLGIAIGININSLIQGRPVKVLESVVGGYWAGLLGLGTTAMLVKDNHIQSTEVGITGFVYIFPPILSAYSYHHLTQGASEL